MGLKATCGESTNERIKRLGIYRAVLDPRSIYVGNISDQEIIELREKLERRNHAISGRRHTDL